MSEMYGAYRVILTLAARNQSRIDLVENTGVQNRKEVLKRILIVPGKEDNRELIDAEEQGAQLQREAHARNPHIIEVYASGRLNEYFFVSMEYVEGRNLEEYQKARGGPLSPVEAASIACELCSQVATLHAFLLTVDGKTQAFLHNDIKPSNIQIRKTDNQIRLIDFGAAKSVTYSRNFTRNDFASVAYCSPERLEKGLSDTQTDLWSIAVVLYEMVAGCLPFRASSHQQLELLITSGAPPAALPEACPANLSAIIYRALSASVADRYPDAAAFGDELQKFCAAPNAAIDDVAGIDNVTRKVTKLPPPGHRCVCRRNRALRVSIALPVPIRVRLPYRGTECRLRLRQWVPQSAPPSNANRSDSPCAPQRELLCFIWCFRPGVRMRTRSASILL